MFLFKFLERQYLNSFFDKGSLRIGTLYDFKDTVNHTAARADSSEGRHHLIRNISSPIKIDKHSQEPIISEMFKVIGDGSCSFQDLSLSVPRDSGDGFIFCTSRLYSHETFHRWNKDSIENNSCYVIVNPLGFISEVTKAINASIDQVQNMDVVYTSDPIIYNSYEAQLSPAITKSAKEYSWQHENRTIWSPKLPPFKLCPFIINAPEARRHCVPLSYIENGNIINY